LTPLAGLEEDMSTETAAFWLIHLFIGVVLPAMAYWGCCREQEEAVEYSTIQFD